MKLLFIIFIISLFINGCAQKVQIKALHPAEVGEMATKKRVAISKFKNDNYSLSGKIESEIAKHKLDKKRYFSVVNRKDLGKVIAEQKLQSSELMDGDTTTRVGLLIGASAIINGEIATQNATSGRYYQQKEKCLKRTKKDGCIKYKYYSVTCNTLTAIVSANINILDVQSGSVIYGDTITKEYDGDTCSGSIYSKTQALNRLTSQIASEFVYKLTPHYIYFSVDLLDKIELDDVTDMQENNFENSLAYIEDGRMDKAENLLQNLIDNFDGQSYVVAYVLGVTQEAQGKLYDAKRAYILADDMSNESVDEINSALVRIKNLITKRDEAIKQIDAK